VEVGPDVGALVGVGVEVGIVHIGTVIVSVSVVTVPLNASALPVQDVVLPTVIPTSSMTVPANVLFAPRVVAKVGVQNTSQADGPLKVTTAPLAEVSAPVILKIYVPLPERVIPPAPIDVAAAIQ